MAASKPHAMKIKPNTKAKTVKALRAKLIGV